MKVTTSIIINKPVKEVWDFFDDPDNLKFWLRGFQKFEHLSGTRGEPGAKSKHSYEENGKIIEMIEEIVVRDKYKEFSGILNHDIMTSNLSHKFEDLGNGTTRLDSTVETKFKPFMLKMLGPLMKGMLRRRQSADFKRFKECVERN